MGANRLALFFVFVGVIIGVTFYYCPNFKACFVGLDPPQLHPEYFGKGKVSGQLPKDNTAITKYVINVGNKTLEDLKTRLSRTRFVEPLENVAFKYGFNGEILKKVVDYWTKDFNWKKQEKELNKFSHFKTQIEGLKIHFIHEKPKLQGKKLRVIPLLLVHGWPGSIAEFTKIIPMLTSPKAGKDFVFEVICPSIPGYGFSEAPHQPGFDSAAAARVFATLMERLGFKNYYAQGGDWGSMIVSVMAKVYPERITGVHFNMIPMGRNFFMYLKYAIGYIFPSLFMSEVEYNEIYSLRSSVAMLLEESGYFHIQATKPDSVGAALIDSPAGLAAYILEKFSTTGGLENIEKPDGGLTELFTMDELLTNIMVYWTTSTAASSARFYKENMQSKFMNLGFDYIPIKVPTGVAIFPREIFRLPCSFLTHQFKDLVRCKRMPNGGHFAALEAPDLLANELFHFVADVEEAEKKRKEETK